MNYYITNINTLHSCLVKLMICELLGNCQGFSSSRSPADITVLYKLHGHWKEKPSSETKNRIMTFLSQTNENSLYWQSPFHWRWVFLWLSKDIGGKEGSVRGTGANGNHHFLPISTAPTPMNKRMRLSFNKAMGMLTNAWISVFSVIPHVPFHPFSTRIPLVIMETVSYENRVGSVFNGGKLPCIQFSELGL